MVVPRKSPAFTACKIRFSSFILSAGGRTSSKAAAKERFPHDLKVSVIPSGRASALCPDSPRRVAHRHGGRPAPARRGLRGKRHDVRPPCSPPAGSGRLGDGMGPGYPYRFRPDGPLRAACPGPAVPRAGGRICL